MAKKSSFVSKIKTFLILIFVLLILLIGGIAGGIFAGVITEEHIGMANEKLGLYKLPVVGEYFDVPEGVVWPPPEEEVTEEEENKEKLAQGTPGQSSAKAETKGEQKQSKDVKIDKKDIEEQMRQRQSAEKKRISKLARIYNGMKPEEAANAFASLDLDTAVLILQKMDEDAVAKVLAKMDPGMAAQVTQMLFEGTQQQVSLPQNITTQ